MFLERCKCSRCDRLDEIPSNHTRVPAVECVGDLYEYALAGRGECPAHFHAAREGFQVLEPQFAVCGLKTRSPVDRQPAAARGHLEDVLLDASYPPIMREHLGPAFDVG